MKYNSRNSAIEIVRIIAMIMIVLSHAAYDGGHETNGIIWKEIVLDWFTLGNIGNHIFILVSGYYLCEKKVNYKSLRKLISQVWCYSLVIFILCNVFGYAYSLEYVLKALFPIIFVEYWFITAYIVLVLISPILNRFIEKATKQEFSNVIFIMLFLWIIVPTFTLLKSNMYGDPIPQFMLMYLIGAWFKKYPDNILSTKKIRYILLVISFVLLYASPIVIEVVGKVIPFAKGYGGILFAKNSLLIVCIAIAIFSYAVYARPFSNKFINTVSSCMFGIYLFHANPIMRELIWKKWLGASIWSGLFLPCRLILDSLIVFVISLIIEYVRQLLLDRYCMNVTNYIFNKIESLIKRLVKKEINE